MENEPVSEPAVNRTESEQSVFTEVVKIVSKKKILKSAIALSIISFLSVGAIIINARA